MLNYYILHSIYVCYGHQRCIWNSILLTFDLNVATLYRHALVYCSPKLGKIHDSCSY